MGVRLDAGKDYIIDLPDTPLVGEGGLRITGGRNVVLIGGQIHHPQAWPSGAQNANRGLYLVNQTGTIHVEGLHISGVLSEGINLSQSQGAIVQLQNIKIDEVKGTKAGNHADLIQTWAGPRQLLVDGLTGSTTYQGFFLTPNQHYSGPAPERFEFHNIDLTGGSSSGYLYWITGDFPVNVSNVWAKPNPSKASDRNQFLWPKASPMWSAVKIGDPPGKDLVTTAGTGYVSPGFR